MCHIGRWEDFKQGREVKENFMVAFEMGLEGIVGLC